MNTYLKKQLFYSTSLLFIFFIACSSVVNEPEEVPEPEPTAVSVKAMSYNIFSTRLGQGMTDEMVQGLAEVIKRADPDIIALQEVDRFTTRNPFDVAERLSELTGMEYHFFAKAMDYVGGEYGEAILSKLPFKETKIHNIGTTPALPGEPRAIAQVLVEKEGKEFYFLGTHFDHLPSDANRIYQAEETVKIVQELDKPVILGGDLNAVPASETMSILREQLALGCQNNICAPTLPARNPTRTVDYLMYAPTDAISVNSYQVYTWASTASDHLPVLATFRLNF